MRLWNNGVNMCTKNGGICVGCAHPRFPEPPTAPFHEEVEGVPTVLGVDLKTWAYALTGIAAAAIAAHAVRRRLGTREPEYEEVKPEPEPEDYEAHQASSASGGSEPIVVHVIPQNVQEKPA